MSGHSTADLAGNIYLFGGLVGSAGSAVTRDLWVYESGSWNQIECETGPSKRMYSASAALNGKFYVFGGWDPETRGSGTFQE